MGGDFGLRSQDARIACAEALEDEEKDIWAASREERIPLEGLRWIEVVGQLPQGLRIVGIVLGIVVLRLPQGREEAEEGIDGSVIEVLAVAEVDLPNIGRRLAHSATDEENGRC